MSQSSYPECSFRGTCSYPVLRPIAGLHFISDKSAWIISLVRVSHVI